MDEDKIGEDKSSGNERSLSNLYMFKKSTKAAYLTSKSAKKGGNKCKKSGGNTKKGVEAAKYSN